jgi:microcystin degradation protein MlrC
MSNFIDFRREDQRPLAGGEAVTRIAIGGIYHESNTFFSRPMTIEHFAEGQLHYGAEIPSHWRGTCSEMNGFMQGVDRYGWEAVPTLMAWGMPSGMVSGETFETLVEDLIARLQAAGPLDGVLLSLHGAMVSERYLDADGEILRRVRTAIGNSLPLVVTLDFHANLTEEMVRWPDAMIGYKTYPHIDQVERGLEAAAILHRILEQGLRPKMALERRPLLPHILSQSTERPPMAKVIAAAEQQEKNRGVLNVSVFAGFPYTDVPQAGFSVLVVAETQDAATDAAKEIADSVWQHRAEFACKIPQPAEAVKQAMTFAEGLTILVDVGDNVGAGTPGDGTVLLAELLHQKAEGALVLLCDPEAVAACVKAGIRQAITCKVGGKSDSHHGPTVEITGTIRLLSDGIFRNVGPMRDGILEDQGRTAMVAVGGTLVMLTERRMPMWNLQQLRATGIEPTGLRIIVVKAAIAYRAAYAPIASRIIEVDTPGHSAADVRRFHYTRLQRPVFPLDAL